jgi:hypothetical protein
MSYNVAEAMKRVDNEKSMAQENFGELESPCLCQRQFRLAPKIDATEYDGRSEKCEARLRRGRRVDEEDE